jgi:hypothetical protein
LLEFSGILTLTEGLPDYITMSGRDGSRPTWDQARDRLLLDQKGQRRKIEFVLSKNTPTSFTKSPYLLANHATKVVSSGNTNVPAAPESTSKVHTSVLNSSLQVLD